jgi:hypothetical protein
MYMFSNLLRSKQYKYFTGGMFLYGFVRSYKSVDIEEMPIAMRSFVSGLNGVLYAIPILNLFQLMRLANRAELYYQKRMYNKNYYADYSNRYNYRELDSYNYHIFW